MTIILNITAEMDGKLETQRFPVKPGEPLIIDADIRVVKVIVETVLD